MLFFGLVMVLYNTPIEFINSNAANLIEEDVDDLIEDLMSFYQEKIKSLSYFAYEGYNNVSYASFKKQSEIALEKGLRTFLFTKQHWIIGRDVEPYLSRILNTLSKEVKRFNFTQKTIHVPICPGCRSLSKRVYIDCIGSEKLLSCQNCEKELERLDKIIQKTSSEEYRYRIHKVFKKHSRKGYRCPSCHRFVPASYLKTTSNDIVSCPYDNCHWFGLKTDMNEMSHPIGLGTHNLFSLNENVFKDSDDKTPFQDTIESYESGADFKIELEEGFIKEYNIVKETIQTQYSRVPKDKRLNNIKKHFMYKAFESILEEDPEGMVNYLTNKKAIGERPIQSIIFQRYISIIEDRLPISIIVRKKEKEIYSLLDEDLDLFLGVSEFYGIVKQSGIVSNNTHEIFVGAKCNGPCFIGMLCNIYDKDDNSLLDKVDYYTFANVRMKKDVQPNTLVKVVHFRIPPHYEMYSLINLQRTRKKIVTSIKKRLERLNNGNC